MKRLPVALSIVSLAGVSGTAQALSWWDRGNNTRVGPTENLQQSHKYFKQQPLTCHWRNMHRGLMSAALKYITNIKWQRQCDCATDKYYSPSQWVAGTERTRSFPDLSSPVASSEHCCKNVWKDATKK